MQSVIDELDRLATADDGTFPDFAAPMQVVCMIWNALVVLPIASLGFLGTVAISPDGLFVQLSSMQDFDRLFLAAVLFAAIAHIIHSGTAFVGPHIASLRARAAVLIVVLNAVMLMSAIAGLLEIDLAIMKTNQFMGAFLGMTVVINTIGFTASRYLRPLPEKNRCDECGYSLRGLCRRSRRCPECGAKIKRRREPIPVEEDPT